MSKCSGVFEVGDHLFRLHDAFVLRFFEVWDHLFRLDDVLFLRLFEVGDHIFRLHNAFLFTICRVIMSRAGIAGWIHVLWSASTVSWVLSQLLLRAATERPY